MHGQARDNGEKRVLTLSFAHFPLFLQFTLFKLLFRLVFRIFC